MELVSLGIDKLWDRLSQEYELFQGVEDQVTELKSNLNSLKSFLKDADVKKHTSERVRNCVKEIKEIVYDAEDITETFILKEEVRKKRGIMKRIGRFPFTIVDRRELASNIGGISKRISKVNQDMQNFGVQQIMIADGSRSSYPLQDRQMEMRQEFPRDSESNLVGLEENVKKLVGYLVEEDDIRIVSVTGMGGLGKTTLARQAFNHEMVKNKFDRLAWVCVSQEFTRIFVWQTILQNLASKEKIDEILKMFRLLETSKEKKDEILKMIEAKLQDELFRLLETSKSLIVLDDIWKEEDWDRIKPIFPPNKGWKVLLTSRNESVAMHRDTTYINFKPECLTIPESWTLFQRIAMPRKDAFESKVDEEMEEMGKKMIVHCRGLPLAVKVLGGMLAKQYTLHDWKRLSENIASHIVGGTNFSDGNNNAAYNVLSLSFEELPSYLKHCFLYLAHFPEDHKINVEDLSYYWAADGIVKPRHYDGETIRDVGNSYIEELVRRNMVISKRDVKTLRFETCHLHDMMREVCLLKATEENFLQVASTHPSTTNFQSSCTSRRFVSHNPTRLHVERDINNPKLRSLMVVPVNDLWWKLSCSSFKRLELLRVLDMYQAKFRGGKLPSGIGKLIHLRYLSLKFTNAYHLPASLGNLLLLIYLNIDVPYSGFIFVPNVLMGMQELRYLALPDSMHQKTKLELSNLVNLETLKNFSSENSSVEDLCGMVRLRSLSIKLTDQTSIETLSTSIGGLRHLEDLEIEAVYASIDGLRIRDRSSKRNLEEGIELDFNNLKRLSLFMYMPKLRNEQHFPSNLTILQLGYCDLEEDPMPILEKLLQLKEVYLQQKSFSGKRMVCSGGGFPQLQKLYLRKLKEWEEWKVEEAAMPLLHTLTIYTCKKLKELPDGLRFITSLKELQILGAPLEFKEKLSRGGEDFYKVQHISLFRLDTCERELKKKLWIGMKRLHSSTKSSSWKIANRIAFRLKNQVNLF